MIKMTRRLCAGQKGMLLAWVLMLLAILSVLTVAALTMASNQFAMGSHYSSSVKSLHYAEAGIHHYLAYLNNEDGSPAAAPPTNTDIHFEDGNYRLNITQDVQNGEMILRSTGWVGEKNGEKSDLRTVDVLLKKRTFAEFGYLSDEDSDLRWMLMEKFYGPYHTNGVFKSFGFNFIKYFNPKFYGPVSYSKGVDLRWGSPIFQQGINQVSPIKLPTSNNELKLRAQNGGYYYEGRTSIMLNKGGTITVRNPNINRGKALENLPLPSNGVIYVDGAVVSHRDKFNKNSGNAFVSGILSGQLTIASSNDIYITGKDPTKWSSTWILCPVYYFALDDSFGRWLGTGGGIKYANTEFIPIKDSRNNIVGYHAEGDDMLGLVANNNIWLLTDGWFVEGGGSNSFSISYPSNLTINGALMAINGEFGHYHSIELNIFANKLIIRGALIQKEAGKVGTLITGYDKDYAHDDRMLYEAPPHFPSPEESGWEILEWNETRDHLIGS